MPRPVVMVSDKMQQGYAYRLTEPAGRNFHPDFRPNYAAGVLELGVFGGKYMTDCAPSSPPTGSRPPSSAPSATTPP